MHDILFLYGKVPETILSCDTLDISIFCEFEWYEFVMFYDIFIPFSYNKMILGRYWDQIIDVFPALTTKILKSKR